MSIKISSIERKISVTAANGETPLYDITEFDEDGVPWIKFQIYYSDGKLCGWASLHRDTFLESLVRLWPENVAFQFTPKEEEI